MRTKTFFTTAFLFMIMTSCTQEKAISELDQIKIIYCTPSEFGKCLPLEIRNTGSGWQAHYVGSPSNESLILKPVYEVNEDGDSIVVMNEYLAGDKQNGKYILHRSSFFSNEYDGVSYINPSGKDTTYFYTNIIKNAVLFTDTNNVAKAILKTMEYDYGGDTIWCGSERRDLNMSYIIHSYPETLQMPIEVENLNTYDSPNGKLRIYTFIGHTGGNGLGSSYDIGILQYETGEGENAVLDFFTNLLYFSLEEFEEANFPFCTIRDVHNVNIGEGTYYLIEALFSDARPVPLNDSDDYFKANDTVLFAFTIKNGKLIPAYILEKEWKVEIAGTNKNPELHFDYDDTTKTVKVPVVEGEAHLFKGEYRQIVLQQ